MKNSLKIALFCLGFGGLSLQAADSAGSDKKAPKVEGKRQARMTFGGKPITASNILQFREIHASDEIVRNTQAFCSKHRILLSGVAGEDLTSDVCVPWQKAVNTYCAEHKMPNKSRGHNVIVEHIPGHLLKLAGPGNREENVKALMKKAYNSDIAGADYTQVRDGGERRSRFLPAQLFTFQTISRAVLGLRGLDIASRSKHLAATPNWLVPLCAGADLPVHDGTFVIVQPCNNGKPLTAKETFSDEELEELIAATCEMPHFTPSPDNYMVLPNGRIDITVDCEQPNNTPPAETFEPEEWRMHNNAAAGLEQLTKTLLACELALTSKADGGDEASIAALRRGRDKIKQLIVHHRAQRHELLENLGKG